MKTAADTALLVFALLVAIDGLLDLPSNRTDAVVLGTLMTLAVGLCVTGLVVVWT